VNNRRKKQWKPEIDLRVRQAKTVTQSAVGALINAGDFSLVPCDTRSWWDSKTEKWIGTEIWGMKRLRRHFPMIRTLRKAPVLTENEEIVKGDRIPVVRFPHWMRCPSCGLLISAPWIEQNKQEDLRCTSDKCSKPKLITVPYVMISLDGFLSDLPWHFLAHRESKHPEMVNCKVRNKLHLNMDSASGRWKIHCKSCNSNTLLTGIQDPKFLFGLHKMRIQPWINAFRPCENTPIAVRLTDLRVHIPYPVSALDIPPESRVNPNDIKARLLQHDSLEELERIYHQNRRFKRKIYDLARNDFLCKPDELEEAYKEIQAGWPDFDFPVGSEETISEIFMEEYTAFTTVFEDMKEWERFLTRHQKTQWITLLNKLTLAPFAAQVAGIIDQLVIAERLREIQAFKGFRRHKSEGKLIPPDLTGELDWLPAAEFFGEGIFFTIKEELLKEWETRQIVIDRAATTEKRRMNSSFSRSLPESTPRFVFMHTLAHLMIRQLEFECGYPAASLRERIYCSDTDEENGGMSGILIYVAVPDKAGSLGGLARQGHPDNFLKLLIKSFERAFWCSMDPICGESDGQGPDQLNRAACHGCCLIPETSCIFNNCLLDRLFLCGVLGEPDLKLGLISEKE
jgi:hypothetical protein